MKIAHASVIAVCLGSVCARNVHIAITAADEWDLLIGGLYFQGSRFFSGLTSEYRVQHLNVDLTPGLHSVSIHTTKFPDYGRGCARFLIASFTADGTVIGKSDADGQWQASTQSYKSVYDEVIHKCINANSTSTALRCVPNHASYVREINQYCDVADDEACKAKSIWPNDCGGNPVNGGHPFNEAWFKYELNVPEEAPVAVAVSSVPKEAFEHVVAEAPVPVAIISVPKEAPVAVDPQLCNQLVVGFVVGLVVGLALWIANYTIDFYRKANARAYTTV